MKIYYCTILVILILASCQDKAPVDKAILEKEIGAAEKSFETMAAEKGIAEAFWFYADSNAVIKRQNDSLIRGKDQIRNYYSTDFYKSASVKWSPDFIAVSAGGDLAYTYGHYNWQSKDSTGAVSTFHGVFHTVWKRQQDGSWKYVWD